MPDIHIASVTNDEASYTVLITLVETKVEEGETVFAPLGEATVMFPKTTPMDQIKKKIVKAAQDIFDAHQDAKDKKKDLTEVDWPKIE